MQKIKLGAKNYLYPNPIIIVGCKVDGRINYLNVSYCGIVNKNPAMIYISINRHHHSFKGILQNKEFSINIPSKKLLRETDYCGIVSGKDVDKSKLFNNFYGENGDIPMIKECAINMECEVIKKVELDYTNVIFIAKVLETYSEEKYLTDDNFDLKKINPILLSMYEFNYYSVGEKLGKAWNIGS